MEGDALSRAAGSARQHKSTDDFEEIEKLYNTNPVESSR